MSPPSPELPRTSIQLRWADTDAYGHVNNVTWVRYMEEARIRLFGLPDFPGTADPDRAPLFGVLGSDTFTITAGQRLEYVRELNYHVQSIVAETWISRIGSSSMDMSFRFLDEVSGDTYLLGVTNLVICDVAAHRPRKLTGNEITTLSQYLADPIDFR